VLADLAIGRMRTVGKLADLSQALTGRFTEHHAALCRLHLDRIALSGTAVDGLEQKIAVKATPYQRELGLLKSIDGFGDAVAHAWLAEIGPAPHEYFGRHEKLASWVTLCPGNYMSGGKRSHGRTGNAGTYIKPMLGLHHYHHPRGGCLTTSTMPCLAVPADRGIAVTRSARIQRSPAPHI